MAKSTARILCWNVNGIRAAAKKGFLDWIQKEDADIICLQETKAHPDQLDMSLTQIPGYEAHWSSAVKKGYSGVGVYTKIKPISVKQGFGLEKFDSEGRTLVVEFADFVLFCVYFPNGKRDDIRLQYKMDFYEEILKFWESLRKKGKKLIICGDVNTAHKEIDLARPKENSKISGFLPQERAWIDKIVEKGYVDIFRKFNDQPGQYTWWDMLTRARERNVGWRIDYFFVTTDLVSSIKSAWICPDVLGSDHCPIGIEVKLS